MNGCSRVKILKEVVGHCHPRLHLRHDLAEGFRCRVDLRTHQQRGLGREAHLVDQIGHRDKALVDDEIGVQGVLREPGIGIGVAREDELEAVPLEAVAHRAVDHVDGGPRADDDAVLLVDDLVLALVVELVDLEALPRRGQAPGAAADAATDFVADFDARINDSAHLT